MVGYLVRNTVFRRVCFMEAERMFLRYPPRGTGRFGLGRARKDWLGVEEV